MDAYRTEEEQIEAIKHFFQKHGTNVLLGFALFIALFFGYQHWEKTQSDKAEEASVFYNEMRQLVITENEVSPEARAKFDEIYAKLLSEHKETIYASYASFIKAKLEVDAGALDKAAATLKWVVDADVNQEIVALANLRLARVLFAQGEADKALKVLDAQSSPYTSAFEELRGDIYVETKQPVKALESYNKALELKDDKVVGADKMLKMKISSLNAGDSSKVVSPGASAVTPATHQ